MTEAVTIEPTFTLLLHCEDRKGVVFAIARFILEHGGASCMLTSIAIRV